MLLLGRTLGAAHASRHLATCVIDRQRYKQAMRIVIFISLLALSFTARALAAEPTNLLPNPGYEEVKDNLPAHWTPVTLGPAATCELDRQTRHGEAQSLRISA